MIYFMNTSIIPSNFNGIVSVKEITLNDVKSIGIWQYGCFTEQEDMIRCGCEKCTHNLESIIWVSAVGHESTAQIMAAKTGFKIKMNRLNVEAKVGDKFICFQLKTRGQEGKIYMLEEMQQMECVWKILEFKDTFCNCGCNYCGSD